MVGISSPQRDRVRGEDGKTDEGIHAYLAHLLLIRGFPITILDQCPVIGNLHYLDTLSSVKFVHRKE